MTREELLIAAAAADVWPAGHSDAILMIGDREVILYDDWHRAQEASFL